MFVGLALGFGRIRRRKMEFLNLVLEGIGLEAGGAGLLALAMILARSAAKAIPDNAKGFFGILRKITKVVGLYTQNRKTKGDPIG